MPPDRASSYADGAVSGTTYAQYSGSGPVTLYMGPGERAEVSAGCLSACGYTMSIVGYLEDAS